jgi:hypothetical protein
MLTKGEAKFVDVMKVKNKAMATGEKQRLHRIRKKTLKTLDDLIYLAENLPEKQLNQIFNDSTLIQLFTSILHKHDANKKRICKIVISAGNRAV